MIGINVKYSFEATEAGKSYLVKNGIYGYLVSPNCETQKAISNTYYQLKSGDSWVEQVYNCAVEGDAIDLAKLYKVNAYDFESLPKNKGYYFNIYGLTNKLLACGNDNNKGLSHLEKIADVKATGADNEKRKNLMPFIELEFQNINLEMVKWINENLIPDPKQKQANGLPYEFIYNILYKDHFRKLAVLKILITQNGQEALVKDYARISHTKYLDVSQGRADIATRNNTNIYGFLEGRADWMRTLALEADYQNTNIESMDYGFWMRRILDGSEPEI